MTITNREADDARAQIGTCSTLYMILTINHVSLRPFCYVAVREKSAENTLLSRPIAFNLFFLFHFIWNTK